MGGFGRPLFFQAAELLILVELSALVVLALAWLVPNHYPPWMSMYNESAMALALALLALSLRDRWRTGSVPWPAVAMVAVACIPFLQWAAGALHFSGDAVIAFLYVCAFGIAVSAGSLWAQADSFPMATRLAATVLIAGATSSGFALLQMFDLGNLGNLVVDPSAGHRATANLGQPNNFATLLGFAVVSAILLYEQQRLSGLAAASIVLALIVGASLTQSRTAFLYGPLLLAGIWLARRRGIVIKTPLSILGAGVAVHWMLALTWPSLRSALLLDPLESLAAKGVGSVRFTAWPMLLDAAADRPLFGFGFLQVGAAQLSVADRYAEVGELWLQAHNLFVDLIVWCGYPLGVALSVALVLWFADRWWRVSSVEGVAAMLTVTLFGTHAMLELPHHYAYFLIPIGLWIGLVERELGGTAAIRARWMLAPMAVATILVGWLWWQYPAVEEDFRLVRFETLRIGNVRAMQKAPDAPLLSTLTAYLEAARTVPRRNMPEGELELFEQVTRRYPYSRMMMYHATALVLNGRVEESRRMLLKLRNIHGQAAFDRLRLEIRQRVADGEVNLRPLDDQMATCCKSAS